MRLLKPSLLFVLAATTFWSCSKDEEEPATGGGGTAPDCFEQREYTEQLPNMNFEDWGSPENSNGLFQEPCGAVWVTPNKVTQDLGATNNTFKTSDAQDGNSAVKMETKEILIGPIPFKVFGGLFTGKIVGDLDFSNPFGNIERGVPFTERPSSLRGYMKYSPVNGDSAQVEVILRRYDTSTGAQVIIGQGELTFKDAVSEYAEFVVNIEYNNSDTPDSIQVDFYSSKIAGQSLTGEAGSTLFVDNCTFVY